MILSGKEIQSKIGTEIVIDPSTSPANPNSYNLRLHSDLLVYQDDVLDMKKEHATQQIVIPEDGLLLETGKLYLGRLWSILKHTDTFHAGGQVIHRTTRPLRSRLPPDSAMSASAVLDSRDLLRPANPHLSNVEICQIYYHTIEGDYENYSSGNTKTTTAFNPACCLGISRKTPHSVSFRVPEPIHPPTQTPAH